MRARSLRGSLLGIALALAAASSIGSAPATSAAAPKKQRLGAAVAPVRLVATSGAPLTVHGLHRYFGTVELDAAGNGLVVSNRLGLDRYLLGLAEVPLDWPMEALKAQVVAARTFALWTLAAPPHPDASAYGFDICATTQCQVFSGADVIADEDGPRWIAAVDQTRRQAVLYRGAPILARYHSTSGGRTLDNEDAFPGDPSYPYLRSVPSPWEKEAPLFRWLVEFRLRDLEVLLRRAGWWRDGLGRLVQVRTVPSRSGAVYPDVAFRGKKGAFVRTAEELRDLVRDLAPALWPGRYPSRAPTSSGVLPETFPSNRVTIWTRDQVVRVLGRGWGHGSGMSQWGAHGLAQRGYGYVDILGHYYSGTTVGHVADPGPLEVGVAWGQPAATVSGAFRIVDGRGRILVKRALGEWTFRWSGDGVVTIDPPRGFGLPLEVGIVRAPKQVEVGGAAYLTVALSRPARVRLVTSGGPTGYRDPGARVKEAGRQRLAWLAPLEPGRYRVRVLATTGGARTTSAPVDIRVRAADVVDAPEEEEEEPAASDPARAAAGRGLLLRVVGLALLVALIALGVAIGRRGSRP